MKNSDGGVSRPDHVNHFLPPEALKPEGGESSGHRSSIIVHRPPSSSHACKVQRLIIIHIYRHSCHFFRAALVVSLFALWKRAAWTSTAPLIIVDHGEANCSPHPSGTRINNHRETTPQTWAAVSRVETARMIRTRRYLLWHLHTISICPLFCTR